MIDSNLLVLPSAMCSRCLVHSGLSRLGSGCGCRSGYVDPLICCAVGVSGHVLWTLDLEDHRASLLHFTAVFHVILERKHGWVWALRTKRVDNKALPRTEAESVLSDLPASAIILFLWWHVKRWLPRLRVLSLARMVRESHELEKKPISSLSFCPLQGLVDSTLVASAGSCGFLSWVCLVLHDTSYMQPKPVSEQSCRNVAWKDE